MKLPRLWVTAGLVLSLAIAVALSWQWLWSRKPDHGDAAVLRADSGYWISMFIAGTLGTVIGDYCSHNLHLGDAGASILLSRLGIAVCGGSRRPVAVALVLLADCRYGQGGRNRGRRFVRKPGHVGTSTQHAGDWRDLCRAIKKERP
jgi:hypothetical protein